MGEVSTLQALTETTSTDLIPRTLVRQIGGDAAAVVQPDGAGLVVHLRPQNSELLEEGEVLRGQPLGNDSSLHQCFERRGRHFLSDPVVIQEPLKAEMMIDFPAENS